MSTRRTKYLGDWSAACILGLLTGLTILILQRYMSADAVHQLLTFNPADFFTCAQGSPCTLMHVTLRVSSCILCLGKMVLPSHASLW